MNESGAFISDLSMPFRWHRSSAQFWLLVDPDRTSLSNLGAIGEEAQKAGADALLVGSSLLVQSPLADAISALKSSCDLPAIIFPGGHGQLAKNADALLFLTFLSSRNPRWLVDEQVLAAPTVRQMKIPVIPTGYLLIESGSLTSVGYFSGTPPLPRAKPDIAMAHALAAQFMGMHAVFLEAGSGADLPVPTEMVQFVAENIDIPILVGGGIRSPEDAARRAKFADVVVVGNLFEKSDKLPMLKDFADAVHDAR